MVEYTPDKRVVNGSSPFAPTKPLWFLEFFVIVFWIEGSGESTQTQISNDLSC